MTTSKKNPSFPEVLSQTEFGLCMKDTDHRVLSQNEQCLRYCGDQVGAICKKGCMEQPPFVDNGGSGKDLPKTLKHRTVDDRCFDIVVFPSQNHLLTVLRPIPSALSLSDRLQILSTIDFTPREREVALLMTRGLSNQEICRKLFISRATVKTHINQINKKMKISNCPFELR